jgi:signal transduction histidine kinase
MIIEMLASYAGVAIENARLYERLKDHDKELARRNDELALLNQVGSAMGSSLELDEILNKTLVLLMAHFKVEAGEIFLKGEDGDTLRLTLHRGEAAEAFWTRNRFKIGEGMIGKAAETRQPVISNHLQRDDSAVRQAVIEAGFKQIVCIPLTARGTVVGVLTLAARSQKAFSHYEVQLLVSVGSGAGTAIENARLHYDARRLAVLEERDRIGMDLHDGVIQSIYGVGLSLQNARHLLREDPQVAEQRLGSAMEDLNHTIRDIRNYILDLRPRQLRGDSLMVGLERLITEFRQNTKIEVSLAGPKNEFLNDLPSTNAKALFHICQEALANVAKHAAAGKVSIDLWTTMDRVLLEVTDDGRGFKAESVSQAVGHGLANMQSRVATVGGDLDISTAPGEGTTVLAWVPRALPSNDADKPESEPTKH